MSPSGEGTYAPKSPDLSSFLSSGPTHQPPTSQPQPGPYQTTPSQTTFLQQQHPATDYLYSHPVSQPQPQIPVHAPLKPHISPYSQLPASAHSLHHQYPQPVTATPVHIHQPQDQPQTQTGYGLQPPAAYQPDYNLPYGDQQYQPQAFAPAQFYGASASSAQISPYADSKPLGPIEPQEPSQSQFQLQLQPKSDNMPPRRSAGSSSQQPPVLEPSPVRTKFPTARIKRIMQADEEVGKVAQQTPIAVGKALEMFMIHIVTKSAEVAKEKNSKRVTAAMLKQVVESDEQWDFLREIVRKVDVEAGKGGGKAKAESESEEEPVEKKKGRGGRKKKAA